MPPTKSANDAFSDAIQCGDEAAVKTLLAQSPELAHAQDWTPPPLHCAVLWNQPRIAEILLEHGADIERLDPDRQTTPLRYAIMFARADLIPLLLNHGANRGPIVAEGLSALQLAREAAAGAYEEYDDLPKRGEYEEIIRLLL